GLHVVAFCLMSNHIHIVGIPEEAETLRKAIGRTHFRYTQFFNRLHNHSGHLWQNRFFSCAMDERHFMYCLQYVEQNPVRAGIAKQAWDYPWSSAKAHIGETDFSGLLNLAWWKGIQNPGEWRQILLEGIPESVSTALARNTQTGRPLGSASFIHDVETKLNRRVRPLPGGRPPKEKIR
ncbi:MAG: transposase, partial [Acidobacteria bacterium]|nr:transposase [Acidobacteriota bacterium]